MTLLYILLALLGSMVVGRTGGVTHFKELLRKKDGFSFCCLYLQKGETRKCNLRLTEHIRSSRYLLRHDRYFNRTKTRLFLSRQKRSDMLFQYKRGGFPMVNMSSRKNPSRSEICSLNLPSEKQIKFCFERERRKNARLALFHRNRTESSKERVHNIGDCGDSGNKEELGLSGNKRRRLRVAWKEVLRKVPVSIVMCKNVILKTNRLFKIQLPFLLQTGIAVSMYFLHMMVLSQRAVRFPVQLIPNPSNLFTLIGLDTLAGLAAAVGILLNRPGRRNLIGSLMSDHCSQNGFTKDGSQESSQPPNRPKTSLLRNTESSGILENHREQKNIPNDGSAPYGKNISPCNEVISTGAGVRLAHQKLWSRIGTGKDRFQTLAVLLSLGFAYIGSEYLSIVVEQFLFLLSALNVPISVPMHRSLNVLLGHLLWVFSGVCILQWGLPRFPVIPTLPKSTLLSECPFGEPVRDRYLSGKTGSKECLSSKSTENNQKLLQKDSHKTDIHSTKTTHPKDILHESPNPHLKKMDAEITFQAKGSKQVIGQKTTDKLQMKFFPITNSAWYKLSLKDNWVWWSVGGYYASSFLFSVTDYFNSYAFPIARDLLKRKIFPPPHTTSHFAPPENYSEGNECVVTKLLTPENNDVAALLVGALAPCASAPLWEELLYRGFVLPVMSNIFEKRTLFLSALLFSAHHMSLGSFLPLMVLGHAWAYFYTWSGNLFVTVVIHTMWNTRVFLGSLLGV